MFTREGEERQDTREDQVLAQGACKPTLQAIEKMQKRRTEVAADLLLRIHIGGAEDKHAPRRRATKVIE